MQGCHGAASCAVCANTCHRNAFKQLRGPVRVAIYNCLEGLLQVGRRTIRPRKISSCLPTIHCMLGGSGKIRTASQAWQHALAREAQVSHVCRVVRVRVLAARTSTFLLVLPRRRFRRLAYQSCRTTRRPKYWICYCSKSVATFLRVSPAYTDCENASLNFLKTLKTAASLKTIKA